ncbi:MAG: hypothetical protein ACE5E8_05665 [Acidimicrobiia bacterium]
MTQVTPLPPAPRPRLPSPGPRWRLAVLTAVAGLAIGLLAGISMSEADLESGAETTPSTTGGGTAATEARAAVTLKARVPGFTGTLAWVESQVPFTALTWNAADTAGTAFTLPPRTRGTSWNSDAARVAALVSGEVVDSLSVLIDGAVTTVAVDVVDFAWHGTDPDQIAWIDDDSRVWTAAAPGFEPQVAFGDSRIRHLIAWGDWGYAFQLFGGFDDPRPGFVQTRTGDNQVLGKTDRSVVAVSRDGDAFMLRRDDGAVELTRRDFTTVDVMEWAILSNVSWSPVGEEIAGLVDRGGSINLELRRETAVFEYRLSALGGYIAGWSADGRFVAIVSPSVVREGKRGPGVIVVDLVDRSTHVFAVDAMTAAIW